jgi:type VI secretion system protein ImpI
MAKGLGLTAADLGEQDPVQLGERMGELLALVAEEVRLLLAQQEGNAAPTAGLRPGAGPSNPLTLLPTTEEALRVLFGPPRRAYLDPLQAFQAGLGELRRRQEQTHAAIRAATQVLSDTAPTAVEQAAAGAGGVGRLLGSRKARHWELYLERWGNRPPFDPERPLGSFIEAFAPVEGQVKS